MKAKVLIAALTERPYKSNGEDRIAHQVTMIDQDTGETYYPLDVDSKRDGLLDSLRENLHKVVEVRVRVSQFWNDTPNGRRPQTVVRVIGCAA